MYPGKVGKSGEICNWISLLSCSAVPIFDTRGEIMLYWTVLYILLHTIIIGVSASFSGLWTRSTRFELKEEGALESFRWRIASVMSGEWRVSYFSLELLCFTHGEFLSSR